MSVLRLLRVSLTVSDLPAMEAFYRDTLGFVRVTDPGPVAPAMLRVMGVDAPVAQSVTMRLGAQEIELIAFDPPGQPYPAGSTAHDPWFQHMALVVSDMAAAWARLQQASITPITAGGPQCLPPNTGSVIAFKFRDPEGHPLELLQFPAGVGDPAWRRKAKDALFLGIDHSAIVVRNAADSARFYSSRLGFAELSRSVNRGAEQERLDGTPGDVVDVVALRPSADVTPHVELLGYRVPPPETTAVSAPRDVASTRLVMEASRVATLALSLRNAGVAFVSPDVVDLRDGTCAALLHDPDGHLLLLTGPP